MTFIIKRFLQLTKRNKIFSGRSYNFKGFSSVKRKIDQMICYNYNKPGHFRNDCPDIQNARSIKGSLLEEIFKNKLDKCLIETWDELDNEEDSDKEVEEANLALMAHTLSDS